MTVGSEERKKIEDVLERVKDMQSTLRSIESMLSEIVGESMSQPPEWMIDRLKVWKAIDAKGGIVEYDEYLKILDRVGYDHRGAGGFFKGKNPSLTGVAGDRIALTPRAKEYLDEYKDFLNEL